MGKLTKNHGETTPDGKFFPDCLWCVGAYGLPPVIMIESL